MQGINTQAVTDWISQRRGVVAPLDFELILGGHSNLTYKVKDSAGATWVLRRPPLGNVIQSAHDMGREFKIMNALQNTDIPVPKLVGFCEDESVNGAPFYVMDYVDALVVRNRDVAATLDPSVRIAASRSAVETLARLHKIDPDQVGLGDLGRKQDYVGRQLRRWMRQFDAITQRELPQVAALHKRLETHKPEQAGAGIVHGDFRLDNCMINPDGSIAAVLDWELCTLGEVRADLAVLLVYWSLPDDEMEQLPDAPTTAGGFPSRRELFEWYQQSAGSTVEDIDYFTAFQFWRLSCILEGVYTRYRAASMGAAGDSVDIERFGERVLDLVDRANAILDGESLLDG